MKLDINKACGSEGICSEHIKYADKALVPLLSLCFNSFLLVDFCQSQCCQLYLCQCLRIKLVKYILKTITVQFL